MLEVKLCTFAMGRLYLPFHSSIHHRCNRLICMKLKPVMREKTINLINN